MSIPVFVNTSSITVVKIGCCFSQSPVKVPDCETWISSNKGFFSLINKNQYWLCRNTNGKTATPLLLHQGSLTPCILSFLINYLLNYTLSTVIKVKNSFKNYF